MGKIKSFEIFFADGKTVYHPGEVVRGRCIIELREDLRLRFLRMLMRGEAKVHWTESKSTGTRLGAHLQHYDAEVVYFSKKKILFGSEISSELSFLKEGKREFDFSFDLPSEGVCTSFEGRHGSIRYSLKAELSKPWAFNVKVKKAFTVINPININKREFRVPVENSAEQTLCCWLCRSGLISLAARTDRKGYCPGESVAIWAEFSNQSSRTVVPYATLNQTQTFFANGKTRIHACKFTALTGAHIKGHDQAAWNGQLLKIPAVSPTVSNCCVIKVEYFIKVALHIPGAFNLSMHLPIIVGTVPFRRPVSHYRSPQVPMLLSTGSRESSLNPPNEILLSNDRPPNSNWPPPPYQENSPSDDSISCPTNPPAYVETLTGAVDIRDGEDDWLGRSNGAYMFTPMYAYVSNYRYTSPPAYSEVDPFPVLSQQ